MAFRSRPAHALLRCGRRAALSGRGGPCAAGTPAGFVRTGLSPVGTRLSPVGTRLSPVGTRLSPVGTRLSPVEARLSPVSIGADLVRAARGARPVCGGRQTRAPVRQAGQSAGGRAVRRREKRTNPVSVFADGIRPCGEDRIRTYETLWGFTRFPGVPLQPLEHLSRVRLKRLSLSETGCKVTN